MEPVPDNRLKLFSVSDLTKEINEIIFKFHSTHGNRKVSLIMEDEYM
jgi:hypothetical protein